MAPHSRSWNRPTRASQSASGIIARAINGDLLRDDEIEAEQGNVGQLALEDDGEVRRVFKQRERLEKRLVFGRDQDRARRNILNPAIFEPKARGFSLHYRAVPSAGPALRNGLAALITGHNDFELLAGNMIWEVRPRGVDKGTAVAQLMERAPFAGRLPVFLGDDIAGLGSKVGVPVAAPFAAVAPQARPLGRREARHRPARHHEEAG